jgi:spore germination protein KB
LFAATLLLPLNQMHAANLMPVLASGLGPAALNSLIAIGLFGEVIVAWMLIPYLDRPQQARAHIVAYILVSGAVLVGAALAVVAVFGPTANALLLPVYSLGRITMIADIVERVEMIPLGIWTLVSWLKVGLFLWIISVGVGQLVGLRDHRPLIWPLGLLALAFTGVLHKDVFGVVRFFRWEVLGVYACSVQALLLGALWAAALIRGKDQRGGPGKGRTTARDGRGGRRRPPAKVPPDGEPDHSPPGGHVMGGEGL